MVLCMNLFSRCECSLCLQCRQHLRRCIQEAVVSAAEQQQQRDASASGQGLHPAISALAAEDRTGSIIYTDEVRQSLRLSLSVAIQSHPVFQQGPTMWHALPSALFLVTCCEQ